MKEIKEILKKVGLQHSKEEWNDYALKESIEKLESYINSHYIAKEKVLQLRKTMSKSYYEMNEDKNTGVWLVAIDMLIRPTPIQEEDKE